MSPLVILKTRPGGRLVAVKRCGVLAAVTVKLNGCPANPTVDKALVMVGSPLEVAPPVVPLVGYRRLLEMTCFDWSALYQDKWACAEPPAWRYSSFKS